MKVLLIFPPSSPNFHMPYLSVPALGAYLKREEPTWGVKMIDANIELARRVLSPDGIARFKKAFRDAIQNATTEAEKSWPKQKLAELIKIEKFLAVYPDDWRKWYFSGDPKLSGFIMNRLFSLEIWLNYVLTYATQASFSTQQETLNWADNYPEGIMTEYFRNEVVPVVKNFAPDLIGYSWIDHGQVLPSLIFDRFFREAGIKARTVIGGPFVSLLWERLKKSPVADRFDHFVDRQGEEPLLRLARSVERGEPPEKIGKFMTPIDPDVRALPTPDFGDYPLDKYYGREKKLTLLGSWGCYWGECSFCNVRRLEGIRFKPRKPEQIVQDMKVLKEKYNPDIVRLADNAISFATMVKMAELLVEQNVGLPWATNTRFDGKWTREGAALLKKSGCSQLLFGLESAADDVMNLVHKGTDLDLVREILAAIEPTGIWCHFYMIVGFPSETREDWMRTIKFFEGISKSFPKLGFSIHLAGFGLQIQSPMYHNPKAYHVAEITEPNPESWSTICAYKLEPGVSDLTKEPGVFEEMKKLLDDVAYRAMTRRMPMRTRIGNKLFILKQKIRMLAGI